MTPWILILTLYGYYDGAIAIQEFYTKEACIVARDLWVKQSNWSDNDSRWGRAICVPKGN